MFVVDSSGSVGEDNFLKMKQFMKETINFFDIGTKFTRVGIITFSTYARLEFGLGKYNNSQDLLDAVDRITYSQGGTDTGQCSPSSSKFKRSCCVDFYVTFNTETVKVRSLKIMFHSKTQTDIRVHF